MATVEIWIQLEHHFWDVAPQNIDRMTGETMPTKTGQPSVNRTNTRPGGPSVTRLMHRPLQPEALILRRYTPNWAAPDDRKVNPWDMNEPNPTDTGTMGTIPGPVIECAVGDDVRVHFRNKDFRRTDPFIATSPLIPIESRTHSLHPHGFVFASKFDGAYPLTPPDTGQPVGAEGPLWTAIGVTGGSKQGDRVPPDGTFTYRWETLGWPTTAGVWLYHDHSICDTENVELGAIGIIVIHNAADPNDVSNPPLPNNSAIGSPTRWECFLPEIEVVFAAAQLEGLGQAFADPNQVRALPHGHFGRVGEDMGPHGAHQEATAEPASHRSNPHSNDDNEQHEHPQGTCEHCPECKSCDECPHCDHDEEAPVLARSFLSGGTIFELDLETLRVARLCFSVFRPPPDAAQYLMLYHELKGVGMCVNGRKFLGNTPTVVAGENTKMRFGVVGMGNFDGFHTFHLHGHRWIIPGPEGNSRNAIENSPQIAPVSQFEDTRAFGPANSFSFTIDPAQSGTFMRAEPPFGEWHMHCHVLNHMMDGMMGSLLIVQPSQAAPPTTLLPVGKPCPAHVPGGHGGPVQPGTKKVFVRSQSGAQPKGFDPVTLAISPGDTVVWEWATTASHSVTSDTGVFNSGTHAGPLGHTFSHTFSGAAAGQTFPYHCVLHGSPGGQTAPNDMSGTIQVT